MTRSKIHLTARARSRQQQRRLLAIHVLLQETAWLADPPLWHEGRVAWQGSRGLKLPKISDLANAQRRLRQIALLARVTPQAQSTIRGWLEPRTAHLELAKRLQPIYVRDLADLVQRVLRHDLVAAERLAELLIVEAVCLQPLPHTPSVILSPLGTRGVPILQRLLADPTLPVSAQALIGLTWGAMLRRDSASPAPRPTLTSEWLQRAFECGLRDGLPADPSALTALLAVPAGASLAARYVAAINNLHPLQLDTAWLREQLFRGLDPARIVALAEAPARAKPLLQRLRVRAPEVAEQPLRERQALAAAQRAQQEHVITILNSNIQHYLHATREPDVIGAIVAYTELLQTIVDDLPLLAHVLEQTLQRGLSLAVALQVPYLRLLVTSHPDLWAEVYAARERPNIAPQTWKSHVEQAIERSKRLGLLLRRCEDPALAAVMLRMQIFNKLCARPLADKQMYRWFMLLVEKFDLVDSWSAGRLLDALNHFNSEDRARAVLQPLLNGLMSAPLASRGPLLHEILSVIASTRQLLRTSIPRLLPYLPQLMRYVRLPNAEPEYANVVVQAALALDGLPDAVSRLDWFVNYFSEVQQAEYSWQQAMVFGVRFAALVAAGDAAQFQAIVRACATHDLEVDGQQLAAYLTMLERWPSLHEPLAILFPQQPQRCAQLILRIGLTGRLGAEVLQALETLIIEHDQPLEVAMFGVEWRTLLHVAPDLMPLAATYIHAQWLRGLPPSLPAGVRRVMAQPQRMAFEAAYLWDLIAQQPHRRDLITRLMHLEAWVEAPEQHAESMLIEIRERLKQITAEAMFAAAEQQVLICYRQRLATLAGPLPADLVMTNDWLNAVLLVCDITENRRMLVRLLRAEVAGDTDWADRHPANQTFLRTLASRGVAVEVWLSTLPRVYRTPAIPGERIHLHLERNPLSILQMGNYFDTCLSVGQMNAFSTVANACERNKRVIYATDHMGRVIGRKLIGITAEGTLIGFRTYTTLSGAAADMLRATLSAYAQAFAARCNLVLGETGTIPTLFAEDWYDDGVVPWDEPAPDLDLIKQRSARPD